MTPTERLEAAMTGDLSIIYDVDLAIEIDATTVFDADDGDGLGALTWALECGARRTPGPQDGTHTLTLEGSAVAFDRERNLQQLFRALGEQEVGELVSVRVERVERFRSDPPPPERPLRHYHVRVAPARADGQGRVVRIDLATSLGFANQLGDARIKQFMQQQRALPYDQRLYPITGLRMGFGGDRVEFAPFARIYDPEGPLDTATVALFLTEPCYADEPEACPYEDTTCTGCHGPLIGGDVPLWCGNPDLPMTLGQPIAEIWSPGGHDRALVHEACL